MKRITLISCTASKRDCPAPARDLYDESAYFRKMRAWADARGKEWYILSAKHGVVHPNEYLSPYDARGLDADQARDIAAVISSQDVDVVDICAGRDYTEHLIPELERRGVDVVEHFAGEQIGTRMKHLAEATDELRE